MRELGSFYVDDLLWLKFDNVLYFKPEYMNKESRSVKYLKIDFQEEVGVIGLLGRYNRNDDDNVLSKNFVNIIIFRCIKRKILQTRKMVDISFDGYFHQARW